MNEKTVSVAGGKFQVELLEAGSGDAVVFLHGAGGLLWDPVLEGLSQKYHVIAPRMPGSGGSTGLQHLLDHHDLFFFYLDLLDTLGLERAHLVGHSLGGWIAAELAALEPARFPKLALLAPIGLWNDDYPVKDFFTLMPNELAEIVFHDIKHPAAQMLLNPPQDPEASKLAAIETAKNRTAAARFIWPIPDKGLKDRIHRIQADTLIIWGKSDRLAPVQYADDFQRLIKNSTVAILDRSGHLPQVEQPDDTLTKVAEFLA